MKKLLLILLLIMVMVGASADDLENNELILETLVPENYGIHTPDNAIKLDQLLFQFNTEAGSSELLTDARFPIPSFEQSRGQTFTLIYYGNLSNVYNVQIKTESVDGFVHVGGDSALTVPVAISYTEPEEKPDDIDIVNDEENGFCNVVIPPAGPRRGVEVVDLNVAWEEQRDLIPGQYELLLNIELLSNS